MRQAATKDLILVPRKEYEAFLAFKKAREFKPSKAVIKSLRQAEKNLREGKTLSYDELVEKLGLKNRSQCL